MANTFSKQEYHLTLPKALYDHMISNRLEIEACVEKDSVLHDKEDTTVI